MRNLTSTHRLQAQSIPEVTEPYDRLVLRTAHARQFDGGKVRPSYVLNAIVMHFLAMPEAQQDAAIAAQLDLLEAIMKGDDAPVGPSTLPVPEPKALVRDRMTPAPARRRRKGGAS